MESGHNGDAFAREHEILQIDQHLVERLWCETLKEIEVIESALEKKEEMPRAALIEQLQRLATLGNERRQVRPARDVAQTLGVVERHENEIDVVTGKRFDTD
jgi:hypothetical protein